MWTAAERIEENVIIAVIQQLKELQLQPEKNSGLNGIWTHDLCDSDVNAVPLSYKLQAKISL